MVYLIENPAQRICKIGYSQNPKLRLAALQTAAACDLVLVGVLPGGREKEAELHGLFDGQRVRGEWFHSSEDLTQTFLDPSLEAAQPLPSRTTKRRGQPYIYLEAITMGKGKVVRRADITGMNEADVTALMEKIKQEMYPKTRIFCTNKTTEPKRIK